MTTVYATVQDIEDAWRDLSTAEEQQAAKLLDYASAKMRILVPGLDAALLAGTIEALAAEAVCVSLVKRAMIAGTSGDGVTQTADQVGQVSSSQTYANPMGTMYLTDEDFLLLGAKAPGNRAVSMSVPFAEWPTSYETCWPYV